MMTKSNNGIIIKKDKKAENIGIKANLLSL